MTLKKAGNHLKGLCPFHSEKTPSFTVHSDRQFFYCFGCQTGGDVITFLRELNGYGFMEAVRHLADRAGIEIPEDRHPETPARRRQRATQRALKDECYEIGKAALRFFRERLDGGMGGPGREYLRQRGITRESVERYAIGFAPDAWDGLCTYLDREGFDLRRAEVVGLVVPRKRAGGGFYDRFRDRVIFPVRNIAGDVVAFSGRTLSADKDVAKYVNSPETPVFVKGRTLYGLHEARRAMREAGVALLVEGQVDVVSLAQAGIGHVVAPMGTALTAEQCRLIRRLVPHVVLAYDGDKAGRAATEKAIPTALAAGLEIGVVTLDDGEDPDSFVRRHGSEGLTQRMAEARPGWEHLVTAVIAQTRAARSQHGKIRAIDALGPVLREIDDPRLRELYEGDLAAALAIDGRQLKSFLRQSRAPERRRAEAAPATRPVDPGRPPPHHEVRLFGLMLREPACCSLYVAHDVGELVTHAGLRRAADAFAAAWDEQERIDVGSFVAELHDRALAVLMFQHLSDEEAPRAENWSMEFSSTETVLRAKALERQRQVLTVQTQQAGFAGDEDEQMRLLAAKLELARKDEGLKGSRGA